MDLAGLDGVTLRNLDEMYFVHGSLFPLRSNQHEVILARHLMVKGDYLSLPRAAQFAGRMPLPRPLPIPTLQAKMNIFLKAKLALLDPLPSDRRYKACVENGLLNIVCENVFTLGVTLQSVSRESDWMVVHFVCPRLFVASHAEKEEKNDITRNDIIQLESHLSKLSTTSWKLKVLLQTAEHVSNRIQMQDLYLTLRDKKRSLYHHLVDLRLDQQVDCHRLLLFFWRSEFTGEPLFTLQITSQSLDPSILTSSLDDHFRAKIDLIWRATDTIVPGLSHLLPDLNSFLAWSDGSENIINRVISSLAEVRIAMLAQRLARDLQGIPPHQQSDISFKQTLTWVSLTYTSTTAGNVEVSITVDRQSGTYIVHTHGLGGIWAFHGKDIMRFQAEINNVQAEAFLGRAFCHLSCLSTLIVDSSLITVGESCCDPDAISTLPMVLRVLVLLPYCSALQNSYSPASEVEHTNLYGNFRRLHAAMSIYRLCYYDDVDERKKSLVPLQHCFGALPSTTNSSLMGSTKSNRRVDAIASSKPTIRANSSSDKFKRKLRLIYLAIALSDTHLKIIVLEAKSEAVNDKLSLITLLRQEEVLSEDRTVKISPEEVTVTLSVKLGQAMPFKPAIQLQALPALSQSSLIDLPTAEDRIIAFSVNECLQILYFAHTLPSTISSVNLALSKLTSQYLGHVGIDEKEGLCAVRVRHYVRDVGAAIIHSWAIESVFFRSVNHVDHWVRTQGLISLALSEICASFCCSSDQDYISGVRSTICLLRAVIALATAGVYGEVNYVDENDDTHKFSVRVLSVESSNLRGGGGSNGHESVSPFNMVLALDHWKDEQQNLVGYVRLKAHSRYLSSSYNLADTILISDLFHNPITSWSPQDVHIKKLPSLLRVVNDYLIDNYNLS
eukprot:scaffold1869_cov163-Ochromonas_danica.AAC.14